MTFLALAIRTAQRDAVTWRACCCYWCAMGVLTLLEMKEQAQ